MGSTDSDRNSADADALPPRDSVPYEILRFSTDNFPEHRRIEAYREIYGRIIIKHEIKPIGDQPFHFDGSLCNLPGLGLAVSRFSPCVRSHGLQHNDSEHLVLGIGRSGGCVVQRLPHRSVNRDPLQAMHDRAAIRQHAQQTGDGAASAVASGASIGQLDGGIGRLAP